MLDAQLRAFSAFARHLSYTEAANELHISQPVVSRHLADLQRHLRVQLVQRAGRRNSLTPAGEFLAKHVLQAEAMLEHATRNVAAFAAEAAALHVVASGTPGTYLLPPVITEFASAHPSTNIELSVMIAADAEDAVRAHRFELGIVGAFDPVPDLQSEALVSDELVLVGPASMRGVTFSAKELERLTWIGREEGTATRTRVERLWRQLGISPRRRIVLPTREGVKLAVAAGAGIAATSRFAITVEENANLLVVLKAPSWRLRRQIYLIRSRGLPLTPAAEAFLAVVRRTWPQSKPRRKTRS